MFRFLARRRTARRFAERWRAVESEFAQGPGHCLPAAPASGPPGSRSSASPAADGTVAPTGVPIPLRPSVGATTTSYPMCACGVPLPLHREHQPCQGIERVAGGCLPAAPAPGDALGASAGPTHSPLPVSVQDRPGRPPT